MFSDIIAYAGIGLSGAVVVTASVAASIGAFRQSRDAGADYFSAILNGVLFVPETAYYFGKDKVAELYYDEGERYEMPNMDRRQ
jgi:hypothetical protein